jgi:hypothetical protein
MPNTCQDAREEVRVAIQRLAGLNPPTIPRGFTQAMQAYLTAMDYDDIALMRSRLAEAAESFQAGLVEDIRGRLGAPERIRQTCREVLETVKDHPLENWDEPGRLLESLFDGILAGLTEIINGPVKVLQQHGYPIANAAVLEDEINELHRMKQGILSDWPWSSRDLLPVNRDMVAASRAAIRRHEGEPIEDLIRRLGGQSHTGS